MEDVVHPPHLGIDGAKTECVADSSGPGPDLEFGEGWSGGEYERGEEGLS